LEQVFSSFFLNEIQVKYCLLFF